MADDANNNNSPSTNMSTMNNEPIEHNNDEHTTRNNNSTKYTVVKLPLNCDVEYIEDFVPEPMRTKLFETFSEKLPWEQKAKQGRATAMYADEGVLYEYGGGTVEGADATPNPWIPELLELRKLVTDFTGVYFDSCLCNYYVNGKKFIGFHSDREEVGKTTPIASISLGAERIFSFQANGAPRDSAFSFSLKNGSLLVMHSNCQSGYKHSLPQMKDLTEARVNLTFRKS